MAGAAGWTGAPGARVRVGPGNGWRQEPGGAVRIGGAPGGAPAAPWQAPAIPAGAYNPIRDIELNAGKRGLNNTLEELGTKQTNENVNYQLGRENVQRGEAEQTDARNTTLANLAQSYQRLGVKQGEQANTAGVMRGSAIMQAAAKRAGNEGKTKGQEEVAYGHQQEADQRSLAQLALSHQQESEANTTGEQRAEREQAQFGVDTQTLEGREAAENGYVAPQNPADVQWSRNPAVRIRQMAQLKREGSVA